MKFYRGIKSMNSRHYYGKIKIIFLKNDLFLTQVIESLTQTTRDKILLYANLFIILTGAIGFYIYFSINPFSEKEILILQSEVLKNISTSLQKGIINKI